MKNQVKKLHRTISFLKKKGATMLTGFLFISILFGSFQAQAQERRTIKGKITDEQNEPIVGATVVLKGTTMGAVADVNGEFTLTIPTGEQTISFSFVGMEKVDVKVVTQDYVAVTMKSSSIQIAETVIVGYGQQKKESVVGAITQTKGEVLERAGGVSSVGSALTGSLPGVITVASKGTPGDEDPKIYIRGQGTWNNSDPLILVDGIERSMSSVDISSIESISVLKDASATAVFGVKGANGVILITTKRGKEGKADIRITANSTMKVPSRLATKADSYDALSVRNQAIINELGLNEASWDEYTPQGELDKYRNPSSVEEAERYPNIDWAEQLVKDFTMSYNANISASGGTKFVKYFTSLDYLYEGDILKKVETNKTYSPGYGFNRINVRSNLDFNLTKTTTFSSNLSGSYGIRQDTYGQDSWEYRIWQSIYSNPPDVYYPYYSDGSWGFYPPDEVSTVNSLATMANNGVRKRYTTRINTDFTLKQELGFLLKGLNAKGTLSFDNTFSSSGGIYDNGDVQNKYINPVTGEVTYSKYLGRNQFDWIETRWGTRADEVSNGSTFRKLFYQLQLDYARKFGLHNVTAMGLFSRDRYATGSEFEHFREDWVFRSTYNYSSKYFAEFNGAYNGSEKFGAEHRFGFFPSAALGWMISEEGFMKDISFLDMLKIRGSYGQVGDDNVGRWLYITQWAYGGNSPLGEKAGDNSPYTWWKESALGNADIHWEVVTKANLAIDYAIFDGLFAGSIDIFSDYRTDILLEGNRRAVPAYFGATPAVANIGEVKVKGYELELRYNKVLANKLRLWGNFSMSHAKDEIIEADDPALKDDYLKDEGKQIGQTRSQISSGYYTTWDEVYSSTKLETYDSDKLPGNLYINDFNGDGVIDNYDSVPFGYPERPQNTYNATLGAEWKGFSAFVQFYGVNNANRYVSLASFSGHLNRVYNIGSLWTPENPDATTPMPRWNTHMDYSGTTYLYDGSYVRLKNVELAYTFGKTSLKKLGISSLRVYLNGNNLLMWTNMPDDREVNMGASSAYPTVRRFNLGLNITL